MESLWPQKPLQAAMHGHEHEHNGPETGCPSKSNATSLSRSTSHVVIDIYPSAADAYVNPGAGNEEPHSFLGLGFEALSKPIDWLAKRIPVSRKLQGDSAGE
ncbi:hypothetical protein TorRG33x02_192310 [Trema orientale]|uniref:Uncharacterized protein n=1 Tax=Trema orientale TaxID=63057 RepID=A0A2P5EHH4_TREOI|nr:hypothetical protein TorRG33x02_192310 [Trema orientale]